MFFVGPHAFWHFHWNLRIFRSPGFCKILVYAMLVRYRRINNKGVLDRPWTIWKVLRAISSTLKCQFTGNHENEKIWLFGETEHRRPGVYKVAQGVSAHFCLAKTPSIAIWGQKTTLSCPPTFFQVHQQVPSQRWVAECSLCWLLSVLLAFAQKSLTCVSSSHMHPYFTNRWVLVVQTWRAQNACIHLFIRLPCIP